MMETFYCIPILKLEIAYYWFFVLMYFFGIFQLKCLPIKFMFGSLKDFWFSVLMQPPLFTAQQAIKNSFISALLMLQCCTILTASCPFFETVQLNFQLILIQVRRPVGAHLNGYPQQNMTSIIRYVIPQSIFIFIFEVAQCFFCALSLMLFRAL